MLLIIAQYYDSIGNWLIQLSLGIIVIALLYMLFGLQRNESKIPMHLVWFKVSAVIPFTLFIWIAPAVFLFVVLNDKFLNIGHMHPGLGVMAFIVGFFLPNLALLRRTNLNEILPADYFSILLQIIAWVGEQTVGYPQKILLGLEYEAKKKYRTQNQEIPVDKAFEFHSVEIAERLCSDSPKKIFHVVDRDEKLGYLVRYLGYKDWPIMIDMIYNEPSVVLPTWRQDHSRINPGESRRIRTSEAASKKRRKMKWGRRRTDTPYAEYFARRNSLGI